MYDRRLLCQCFRLQAKGRNETQHPTLELVMLHRARVWTLPRDGEQLLLRHCACGEKRCCWRG